MRVSGRPVVVYAGLMLLTLVAGLLMRFGRLGLPVGVVKYGGSTMWALMIYWVLAMCVRGWRPVRVGVVAGLVAAGVEFLKLYRVAWLDTFRGTLPGILLLGRYFAWWDIVAYWAAIVVGVWVDARVVRPWVAMREEMQAARQAGLG